MSTIVVDLKRNILIGLLVSLVLFNAMEVGDTRTIYQQLIPSDGNCSSPGEHGCRCEWSTDCNASKYLECIDGKCECEQPLHRIFDASLGKCVSQVGSMCSSQWGWTPECIRNSECEGGRCSCRSGYSRTRTNSCSINFGLECGPSLCNSDRGLACKEGRCSCRDSTYVYSVIHANCIDPEAVVRDIIQGILRQVFNLKVRLAMQTVSAPVRLLIRLALGPFGALIG